MQVLFWITVSVLFYTYIGYGLFLFCYAALFKRKNLVDENHLPNVSVVVPAFNEADIIRQKIINTLALDYPKEKISFFFVVDGSTDDTANIVREYDSINLLYQFKRSGKSAAINRAVAAIQTPIVVFTDANILLQPQCIRKLVRHYVDERIGGVSGEKRIAASDRSLVGFGERLYWQYESLLKKAASDFYTIVGAAGEIFSVRTSLFQPLNENVILDDFTTSANVCLQGFRVVYEPQAVGIEPSSTSLSEERKRKVRISAGCYQAFFSLPQLLNPFRNARLAFQYVSYRALRWMVCPLLLPIAFFSNLFCLQTGDPVYAFFFWVQCLFYLCAFAGWLPLRKSLPGFLWAPFYFAFMVASQYAGFVRYISGKQPVLWEKTTR